MAILMRPAQPEDAGECGRICHDAFRAIATAHNFLPDFPNAEAATGALGMMLGNPNSYGVVAERNGKIAGSNFLDERSAIAGVGPITVDPSVQNEGLGAQLMHAVLQRATERKFAGVRLVQAGYHCRSLSLYLKLGFDVREHLSCVQGQPIGEAIEGYAVRAATVADGEACNALCRAAHGFDRDRELRDAIAQGAARVVVRNGRIAGYVTRIGFSGHAVTETTDDLKALIAAAESFQGPGFLVPTRNGALMRWCLDKGLRVTQSLTLMTMGLYNEPTGGWLPSVLY